MKPGAAFSTAFPPALLKRRGIAPVESPWKTLLGRFGDSAPSERNPPTCQSPKASACPPCVDISKPSFFPKPNEDRVPPACGNQPLVHACLLVSRSVGAFGEGPDSAGVPVGTPAERAVVGPFHAWPSRAASELGRHRLPQS